MGACQAAKTPGFSRTKARKMGRGPSARENRVRSGRPDFDMLMGVWAGQSSRPCCFCGCCSTHRHRTHTEQWHVGVYAVLYITVLKV